MRYVNRAHFPVYPNVGKTRKVRLRNGNHRHKDRPRSGDAREIEPRPQESGTNSPRINYPRGTLTETDTLYNADVPMSDELLIRRIRFSVTGGASGVAGSPLGDSTRDDTKW